VRIEFIDVKQFVVVCNVAERFDPPNVTAGFIQRRGSHYMTEGALCFYDWGPALFTMHVLWSNLGRLKMHHLKMTDTKSRRI